MNKRNATHFADALFAPVSMNTDCPYFVQIAMLPFRQLGKGKPQVIPKSNVQEQPESSFVEIRQSFPTTPYFT